MGFRALAKPERYDELKGEIRGFGVQFPLDFLSEENFKNLKTFEFGLLLLPSYTFT